jgi:hypothetical protein
MAEKKLYVRVRGKVIGPFDFQQLKSLRDRGQFRRFHEVSEDRQKWVAASSIPEFFPDPEGRKAQEQEGQLVESQTTALVTQQSAAIKENEMAISASPAKWYYIDANGERRGPVSKDSLLKLWEKGEITSTTDVWKEGMTDWLPISSLETPGFSSEGATGTLGGTLERPRVVADGWTALKNFAVDPVGGLPPLCRALGGGGAMALGLVFCLIFDACLVLGFVLTLYEIGNGFSPDILAPREKVRLLNIQEVIGNPREMAFGIREDKDLAKLKLIMKVFLLALLPFTSLAIAITIIRAITSGSGNIGSDFLISGSALLPIGFLSPIAALLGPGNWEVIFFLYFMMLCLTILVLNSAFTRIIKLSDRGAIFAIPSCLILTVWLSKVVAAAVIFR